MTDYIPSTDEVRSASSRAIGTDWFDRWLEEQDRQVEEEAYERGREDGREQVWGED